MYLGQVIYHLLSKLSKTDLFVMSKNDTYTPK